ncbi:hypothetical protein MKEN_01451100 [Mycena kentingensis (nom. inval.)]|nr:hypothetical protein MKEN_01451100 [Mycena kentingensis (nom. inval.)]
MSNGSPSAYLLWALLAVSVRLPGLPAPPQPSTSRCSSSRSCSYIYGATTSSRLCLRWDSGRQPGAFKRVMTYSYFATVPLLMIFSVSMAALKYQEGWAVVDTLILPKPMEFWEAAHRRFILPLYFVLSIAWSLELVTHLEELTFWVFLLNQGPRKREWFSSWEFRAWYIGSMLAIIGMPLTTLLKRKHLQTCEAWIFAAGASAGTFTTVCFLYVLWNFPRFIRSVKKEGAVPDVVVRLTTFYHFNCIRVVFRFFFTVPLLTLAIDALADDSYRVVRSPFWSDIFLMTGGIGCFISSAITMLIFFPRSMTTEAGYKAQAVSQHQHSKARAAVTTPLPDYERHPDSPLPSPKSLHSLSRSPPPQHFSFEPAPPPDGEAQLPQQQYFNYSTTGSPRPPSGVARSEDTVWDASVSSSRKPTASTSTSVRYHGSPPIPGIVDRDEMPVYVEEPLDGSDNAPYGRVHHYAMTFTSPIDLPEDDP